MGPHITFWHCAFRKFTKLCGLSVHRYYNLVLRLRKMETRTIKIYIYPQGFNLLTHDDVLKLVKFVICWGLCFQFWRPRIVKLCPIVVTKVWALRRQIMPTDRSLRSQSFTSTFNVSTRVIWSQEKYFCPHRQGHNYRQICTGDHLY